MIQDLIEIIKNVQTKFKDDSDLLGTSYLTAMELQDELETYIDQLSKNDRSCLTQLNMHFLPTSTFQEHSLINCWTEEYIILSEKFDQIYAMMKNYS